MLDAGKVIEEHEVIEAGTGKRHYGAASMRSKAAIIALKNAIRRTYENGGGLREMRDDHLRATMARSIGLREDDYAFKLDVDPKIEGEVEHMCEYCRDAKDE